MRNYCKFHTHDDFLYFIWKITIFKKIVEALKCLYIIKTKTEKVLEWTCLLTNILFLNGIIQSKRFQREKNISQ